MEVTSRMSWLWPGWSDIHRFIHFIGGWILLFFVWICSVLSDLPRVQGLEVVCGPSFTQLSLPFPFFLYPLPPPLHPLVVTFACSLSTLISPSYAPPTSKPSILFSSSPPSSYLHLLSQGPCGTLRGWWGWGWWWCRWWWNSHSVSSFPVLELEASPCSSLSFAHLFLPQFKEERVRMRS